MTINSADIYQTAQRPEYMHRLEYIATGGGCDYVLRDLINGAQILLTDFDKSAETVEQAMQRPAAIAIFTDEDWKTEGAVFVNFERLADALAFMAGNIEPLKQTGRAILEFFGVGTDILELPMAEVMPEVIRQFPHHGDTIDLGKRWHFFAIAARAFEAFHIAKDSSDEQAAQRILRQRQKEISDAIAGWKFYRDDQLGTFYFSECGNTIYATPFWEGQKITPVQVFDTSGEEIHEEQFVAPITGNDDEFVASYIENIKRIIAALFNPDEDRPEDCHP